MQRIIIREAYKTMYSEPDLIKAFESELSGDDRERELLMHCYCDRAEYDAKLIQKALFDDDIDYDILIEVICTRAPEQLNKIKSEWNKLNKTNDQKVIDVLDNRLFYGHFKDLLRELLTRDRRINKEPKEINERAVMLMNGKQRNGKQQQQIIEILSTWSWPCIAALNKQCMKLSEDKTLCDVITGLCDIISFNIVSSTKLKKLSKHFLTVMRR